MEKSSILHIPKSNYAYASNISELTILLRVKKNDINNVYIKYTDPFSWHEKGFRTSIIKMNKSYTTNLFDYYKITFNSITKRVRYIFVLEKENKLSYYGAKLFEDINSLTQNDSDLFNFFNFPYINKEDILVSPKWSKEIIWYQIFIDRFNNVNNPSNLKWNSKENVNNKDKFGGNILGIIDKLDYLKELGIGGIYFTPLFEATSIHKYDTIDYKKIDNDFGTNDDFKLLVNEAHKRNIKIMLDIVFNHCGREHPFFKNVIENYKKSKYYNYFLYFDETKELFIDDVPNYHTFAFTDAMPKWNTANDDVRKYLLEITSFWIKEYDIDGYRLDVSNEVSHLFWKEFCNLSRSLKNDFLIIGENWDNSLPWLDVDQFDSVMNYELYYPITKFFCTNSISTNDFVSMVNDVIISYPINHLTSMFNLLGCHDTIRIKTLCKENEALTKLVYIFLFSFTGCPNIYYGDEIGLSGDRDPDNRRCMDFNLINNDFYLFIKKLIEIRQKHLNIFTLVDIDWLYTKNNVLIYKKENIYIILNNNNNKIKIDYNLEGEFIDLFTNNTINFNEIVLNEYQYFLIKK